MASRWKLPSLVALRRPQAKAVGAIFGRGAPCAREKSRPGFFHRTQQPHARKKAIAKAEGGANFRENDTFVVSTILELRATERKMGLAISCATPVSASSTPKYFPRPSYKGPFLNKGCFSPAGAALSILL